MSYERTHSINYEFIRAHFAYELEKLASSYPRNKTVVFEKDSHNDMKENVCRNDNVQHRKLSNLLALA